jgi:hypothetical protein
MGRISAYSHQKYILRMMLHDQRFWRTAKILAPFDIWLRNPSR